MRRGGIRDHLEGTFHRYATDRSWRVPHFEKTLYDNAQLAALYLEASRSLADPLLEKVGRAILDDLVAAWQRPDGGLIVGFDADDPVGEGAYYTFTPAELSQALGPADARLVGALFGVTAAGERALGGRSVLHRRDEATVARELDVPPAALDEAWARALPRLLAVRAQRPPPAADDKELAGWNGLALMALADAARTLGEPRYLAAAQRVGHFLVERCWDEGSRTMRRGLRRGAPLGEGFLDDYALAALGLLRLHAADGDLAWLGHAAAITAALVERFHDASRDTFFQAPFPPGPRAASAADGSLPLRRPDIDDGVLPSGGSAAALLLIELGASGGGPAAPRSRPPRVARRGAAGAGVAVLVRVLPRRRRSRHRRPARGGHRRRPRRPAHARAHGGARRDHGCAGAAGDPPGGGRARGDPARVPGAGGEDGAAGEADGVRVPARGVRGADGGSGGAAAEAGGGALRAFS